MTGNLPGFIDVIRNLNSPELLEDNVINQVKEAGKRIIFYGDETWVKLFPRQFVEYDGTTSFFVSDYTEVSYFFRVWFLSHAKVLKSCFLFIAWAQESLKY